MIEQQAPCVPGFSTKSPKALLMCNIIINAPT